MGLTCGDQQGRTETTLICLVSLCHTVTIYSLLKLFADTWEHLTHAVLTVNPDEKSLEKSDDGICHTGSYCYCYTQINKRLNAWWYCKLEANIGVSFASCSASIFLSGIESEQLWIIERHIALLWRNVFFFACNVHLHNNAVAFSISIRLFWSKLKPFVPVNHLWMW